MRFFANIQQGRRVKGKWRNYRMKRKDEAQMRHRIKTIVFKVVIEEVKQSVSAKTEKLKRFKNHM